MTEKKGIFGFFKGKNRDSIITEEEANQRNYALSKAKDENTSTEELVATQLKESPITQEIIDFAKDQLNTILNLSGFPSQVSLIKVDDFKLFLDIDNEEDAGRIIGKDGATLEALQILLKTMVFNKFKTSLVIILDTGGYRERKVETIKVNAAKMAKIVIQKNTKAELKPMNASERRTVHMLFQDHDQIKTYSVGEGVTRRIVLENK